jgi:Zn-dependent protease/predicted transcriptional regulator
VARRFGIPIRSITLFIFGGVAEMAGEPPRPSAEFVMAIVGPLSSFVLGYILFGLAALGDNELWPLPLRGVLGYLAWINFIVAGFNMLPAFPLDGGRVLRAALWAIRRNFLWATRVSAFIGSMFGIVLSLGGLVRVLLGDFVGGIWFFIIGLFLRTASQESYQQVALRQALSGATVRRFMRSNPVTIPPDMTLSDALEQYFYQYDYKLFPVAEDDRLIGCVTPGRLRQVPRELWSMRRVGEIAAGCLPENTISPDADVAQALAAMERGGVGRLMVAEGDRLLGIITLKDLLHILSVRMELSGEALSPLGKAASQAA